MTIHHSLLKIEFTPDNIDLFSDQLNGLLPGDLVQLIESRELDEQQIIFDALSQTKSLNTFEYLPVWVQEDLIKDMPPKKVAVLLNALAPDDRTKLLENLHTEQKNLLIKYLSPEEKALTLKLLGYPEDSVGRLMTPDYIAVRMDWKVRQVLDYIRSKGWDSETINVVYAIDDYGKLIDDFRIRQILLAPLDSFVSDIADFKFTALNVDDKTETAINTFRKNDRVALPVIDAKDHLLGIVTLDDILQVSVESDTEDFQNVAGMSPLVEPYMETPFLTLMRKRAGWLTVLFFGEMLTASAMGYYEHEISKAVMLALFIPLIISSGGNSGSQASTLVIRAMALGEITLKDWWRIMRREIFSGLFLGIVLGTIGFFRVLTWGSFFNSYGEHYLMVSFTIFFTLIGVVMWGSLIGALLPLLLKRLGFDPAVSSAPFVATIVDVTGLVIYFSIASTVLRGTLL